MNQSRIQKRLLIINLNQFGYDAAYYYYVKYLHKKYVIDYWCLDNKKSKIDYCGNQIKYFSKPQKVTEWLPLIIKIGSLLRKSAYDNILFRNFKYAFIIKLIGNKKAIYDIRSVSVSSNSFERMRYNTLLKINTYFFERILTISPLIVERLKLKNEKVKIIPLGGESIIMRNDSLVSELKFIYVGTFNGRNIHETVEGLSIFCRNKPSERISYTIIGSGSRSEISRITNAIDKIPENLSVTMVDFVPNHLLYPYFERCNIGVSYVPLKQWYLPQPPTKTYEYLIAGMVVIGTALPSNVEVLNDDNGVIVYDSPESFAKGVDIIYERRIKYDLLAIQRSMSPFHWKTIIEQILAEELI